MRYISDQDFENVCDFLTHAEIVNLKDNETPWPEFEEDYYRLLDGIEAYEGCPLKAAEAYNRAKAMATIAAKAYKDPLNIDGEAFLKYCGVMQDEFYAAMIQLRWNRLKHHKSRTTVLDPVLYHDHLTSLAVASYVEYIPASFV